MRPSSTPTMAHDLPGHIRELFEETCEREQLDAITVESQKQLLMRRADVAAAEHRCSEMEQRLTVVQRECTLSDRAVQSYKTRAEDLERQLVESERKLTSLCNVLTPAVKELQPHYSAAAAVLDSSGRSARPVRDPPPIHSLLTISTKPPPILRFRPPLSPPPASRELASSRSPVTETPIQPSTSWTLVLDRSRPDTQPSQSTITVSSPSVSASLSFSTDTPRISSSIKHPVPRLPLLRGKQRIIRNLIEG